VVFGIKSRSGKRGVCNRFCGKLSFWSSSNTNKLSIQNREKVNKTSTYNSSKISFFFKTSPQVCSNNWWKE
jgi:hypothetical protein